MESKAKSSTKPATKTDKKESAPPPKPNPAPAEPAPPAEADKPVQDGNQEGVQEGHEAAGGSCETLENLKPFLIGGAIVAFGAVLVGLVLLAKKKWQRDVIGQQVHGWLGHSLTAGRCLNIIGVGSHRAYLSLSFDFSASVIITVVEIVASSRSPCSDVNATLTQSGTRSCFPTDQWCDAGYLMKLN